jgi:hypothetical protein
MANASLIQMSYMCKITMNTAEPDQKLLWTQKGRGDVLIENRQRIHYIQMGPRLATVFTGEDAVLRTKVTSS